MTSLAASLLLGALVLAATPSAKVVESAQARGLDDEAIALLSAAIDDASAAGLPAESVEDKVLEGLAKGVAPERISTAAQDLRRRLGLAQQALAEAEVKVEEPDRRVSLERLAATVQGDGQDLLALARESKGASVPTLSAAARQLTELAKRGVAAGQAIPALSALARANQAVELGRVSALLDEYLQEGGSDRAAFLAEVRDRAGRHQALDGLVDHFGGGRDPLNRTGPGVGQPQTPGGKSSTSKSKEPGESSLERSDRAGSIPGMDKQSTGRKSKCVGKKQPAGCE